MKLSPRDLVQRSAPTTVDLSNWVSPFVATTVHACLLLVPTFTALAIGVNDWKVHLQPEFQFFLVVILLVAVAESIVVKTAHNSQETQSVISHSGTRDPLAVKVASAHVILMLLLFWCVQIEMSFRPPSEQSWLTATTQVLGLALCILGGCLRVIAIRTLGAQFCSDIRCEEVIRKGVYRWLAHPSEIGLMLIVIGAPICLRTDFCGVFSVAILVPISAWRIRRESRFLKSFSKPPPGPTVRSLPDVIRPAGFLKS